MVRISGKSIATPEVANRFVEIFLVHSWAKHLRQHDRQTNADREVEERVHSYVAGEPQVQHLPTQTQNHSSEPRFVA